MMGCVKSKALTLAWRLVREKHFSETFPNAKAPWTRRFSDVAFDSLCRILNLSDTKTDWGERNNLVLCIGFQSSFGLEAKDLGFV